VNIDHVIERRGAGRFFHTSRASISWTRVDSDGEKVFQEFELARGQIQSLVAARDLARHEVHLQVPNFEAKGLILCGPAHERTDTGEEFWEGKGFH
jgi:hypothetical protein